MFYNILDVDNDVQRCNFCKSSFIIADSITVENVCNDCGVVYENLSEYEINSSSLGNRGKTSMLQSFLSSTAIENKNIDYSGNKIPVEQAYQLKRLRRLDKFAGNDGNFERNLKDASHIMGILRDRLSLSETITESAYNKYIKILKSNMIKGRSIKAFIVACVYSSCRDVNVPRTLNEIVDAVNANRPLSRKCYNLVVDKFGNDVNSTKLESNVYLARAANNCGLSNKTLLKAIEIWSKVKDNPIMSGKKPTALAMAMLYYASTLTGEKITKSKMASSCNMSKVTLNKRVEEIEKLCKFM